jgi:6,7-dimethyl-8-ribityllumazine synthase
MISEIQGDFVGSGRRFGIVLSRWNAFIGEQLLAGALDALRRHGVKDEHLTLVRVPGSFEIPLAARRLAQARPELDAVICLGVLIRGATPHFDHISAEATKGIAHASFEIDKPMAYGVLTCDTIEQAIERAGTKAGNKGAEAALAALEMANLFAQLPHPKSAKKS